MGKKVIIAIIILIWIAAGLFFWIDPLNVIPEKQQSNNQKVEPQKVVVTESNFDSYLSSQPIVVSLPAEALIELKTENKIYTISKGQVTEGKPENPDITITIPEKYIPEFSNGFCNTIQKAKNNNDLGVELHISTTSASWKYKSLLKYKECFGI